MIGVGINIGIENTVKLHIALTKAGYFTLKQRIQFIVKRKPPMNYKVGQLKNKKIRVVHFVHSLVSGGAEKQLGLLCEGMDKSRYEIVVYCVNGELNYFDDPEITVHIASTNRPFTLKYFRNMFVLVKEFKPDVAHVWLPASVSIPAMIACRLRGVKTIFSYRNKMYFHRALSYPEYFVALLCANKIVSNHEIIDSHILFKCLYRFKRGVVINNAVVVPPEAIKKELPNNPAERFIFVGRLTAQKNPVGLVKALAKIDDHLVWHLDMFGDGEDREEVESLISRFGLQNKITLHGFSSSVYQELLSAGALVFPSTKEGMPNVLVEAMLIGLPIIAGDIAGNRSVTNNASDDTVVWVDPKSENDIAEKLTNVIMNKYVFDQRVRIGKNIASAYTLENMVSSYEACYAVLSGVKR